MDFDDWRSAKGSPDPQKGYITMAKTDSESMLLEPSQPQLYEAVLVKPVPAEEDVSFLQKSSNSIQSLHTVLCMLQCVVMQACQP
jgi:hypothetical protein